MAISISSTNAELLRKIKEIEEDSSVSPLEFKKIRDEADENLEGVSDYSCSEIVKDFQKAADEVVELMQKISLHARKKKASPEDRDALKSAIEYQIAYIVMGYKSSAERL